MQFKDSEDKFEKVNNIASEVYSLASQLKRTSSSAGVAYECNNDVITNDYLDNSLSYLDRIEAVIKKFKEENNGNK